MLLYGNGELVVRGLEPKDAGLLVKWLCDPAVLEYYEGRDRPQNPDLVQKHYYEDNEEEITRGIVIYKTQEIGYIQYYPVGEEEREVYGLTEPFDSIYGMDQFIGETAYWNQGIGSQLILETVKHLTENMGAEKIVMDPQCWNHRALRVYEKNGFVRKKLLPAHEWHEGEYRDCWLIEYSAI